jgi:hypothetical protein
VADRLEEELTSSAVAWALRGAVRIAIAACVIALLLAACLSGDATERFASTAYLAAFFAAIALAVKQLLPERPSKLPALSIPRFPAFLGCALGILISVSVVAALVSQPGGEVFAFAAGFGAVILAAAVRRGTFAPLAARLPVALGPRSLRVAATHGMAASLGALAVAPLLPEDAAATAAAFAYRLFFIAAALLLWTALSQTNVGAFVQEAYARATGRLDRMARDLLFERLATYAAVAAATALIAASLLRGSFSEPFAVIAYLAGVTCAVGVAMECRRLRA